MSPDSVTTAPERLLIVSPVYNEARPPRAHRAAPSPRRSAAPTAGSSSTTARATTRWRSLAAGSASCDFVTVLERAAARGRHRPRPSGPGQGGAGLQPRPARGGLARVHPHRQARRRRRAAAAVVRDAARALPRRARRWGSPGGRLDRARAATAGSSSRSPTRHIHGAVKLYRRECLEAIGGIPERLAWDTDRRDLRADARLRDPQPARPRRPPPPPLGLGRRPPARSRAPRRVRLDPALRAVPWALLRSVKLARVPPAGLSGAAFVYGYARAACVARRGSTTRSSAASSAASCASGCVGPLGAALPRRAVRS